MPKRPIRVSIVVFPECDPSLVYGVFDTLWSAGRLWNSVHGLPDAPSFEPRLVGAEAGPIRLVTGVSIVLENTITDEAHTDVVFVPNVMVKAHEDVNALDSRLLAWIRDRYERGAHVYAACGGSLVLAAAGLLDGLEATTHWAFAPLLRRHFPEVSVLEDRILVQTGPGHRIVCCGGASSWQDLTLLLVARYAGHEEARRISKMFLYQWHREGQLPFASFLENADHDDGVIKNLQSWLSDNFRRREVVAELVRRSRLPKRTLDRRFKRATGYAPLAYVQALRIEHAKRLLETSDDPIEAIASEVGYEDAASFRRLFTRLTGMPPGAYRRKFQVPDEVLASADPALERQVHGRRPVLLRTRAG